jgi:hypothetical protein
MSDRYYVNDNPQPNGDYEVHKDGCYWLSLVRSKTDLGYHWYCNSAVDAAKRIYRQSNGCVHCAQACHTS